MPASNDGKDYTKVRGSYKGQVTSFAAYINKLSAQTLSQNDACELQLRLTKMNSLYDRYDEVQLAIESEASDIAAQLKERMDFESLYYKTMSSAQLLLDSFNKTNTRDESDSSSSAGTVRGKGHSHIKLPTIQLPKFNGSYANWLEFHDTFVSLVHNNDVIDDVNKFHYLRTSLEGSAAIAIKSVDFSASNYSIAWSLLCDRFDNKRILIQNHVSALFNLPSIHRECSSGLKNLIDQINKNLNSLESLGEDVKHWDTLLIHIITQKLDSKTYREWEEHKGRLERDKKITFNYFETFLRNRADVVENLELSRHAGHSAGTSVQQPKVNNKIKTMVSVQSSNNTKNKSCPQCDGDHKLTNCSQFLSLSNQERLKVVPNYKICFNCLSGGHFSNHCKKPTCKICKRRHHTLLHVAEYNAKQSARSQSPLDQPGNSNNVSSDSVPSSSATDTSQNRDVSLSVNLSASEQCNTADVLLSTALIKVRDSNGEEHIARAILDSGSTSSLITEHFCNKLNLPVVNVNKTVLGINNMPSKINKLCRVTMSSTNDVYSATLQCFVLPVITDFVPSAKVDISSLDIPSDFCLADPDFHTPAAVDFIIGADVFWDILGTERVTLGEGRPILFETWLGWVISGPIKSSNCNSQVICNYLKVEPSIENNLMHRIHDDLTRFWQLEEINIPNSHYSAEEKMCEEHFVKNTTRLADGRFCVKIPLKEPPTLLGESRAKASNCFLSLERRFKRQERLAQLYKEFMAEYESMGHMSESTSSNTSQVHHFIPHHGVMRESSTSTKLRAVFNASNPTTTGVSYNDIQMVGPTVQDDLVTILLRFRQHQYVITADVEKMYRQISVHHDFRSLQQIFWRPQPSDPLKTYQLNTVTYGTASAPYLATRCLKQIGLECNDEQVREAILHDFYVDDLISGGDSINQIRHLRDQITAELASACMPLRKWKSNCPQLVPESGHQSLDLNVGSVEPSKTLGLAWHTETDRLHFPMGSSIKEGHSKRDVLSIIAQIFDPLGMLSPCVILMKMLLQQMWLRQLSWDETLPSDIGSSWSDFLQSLPLLNEIHIPRLVLCRNRQWTEIHVFSDASEKAFGACLYLRSGNEEGSMLVNLLMAKSRVAPIKHTTIPRLELCGALIAARMYSKVIKSLRLLVDSVTFWTDSTIVLGWLRMAPSKLQPFVRNRVAEIMDTTGNSTWRHVPTLDNPADLISRGVPISSLNGLDLWWSGPSFLRLEESPWPAPIKNIKFENLPETKPEVSLNVTIKDSHPSLVDFDRFSSFVKLQRVAAYCLRFINACRGNKKPFLALSNDEIKSGLKIIIKNCQSQSFPEYSLLVNGKALPKKSPLNKFNVFLDQDKIMRVGGRLSNADYAYEKKHPILLQSTHQFTKLLFHHEHINLMHAGPQQLLYSIRETYWPIGGQRLAKSCYRKCVRCIRFKGRTVAPIMGSLPRDRVSPTHGGVFSTVGVDYAGPLHAASRQGRGCRLVKVYILIFVCFWTKAIHLELVGDLTSNNYLLALRRFSSRRGKPVQIYSDNGTSFVGAYNELSKFLKRECSSLEEEASKDGITFKFIPAYSPHFGGLWEAGVRSTKYHLQRVMGNCNLTYEELNSTLIQIEAILNSRPLTPMSNNPEDLMPLTPGHFLIGRPLTSLPAENHLDGNPKYLSRYQRIEQCRQHFWVRWHKEYVSELQQRQKWKINSFSLKINTLVILKDDNLPPLRWKLGRIVAIYPGSDGISRVADVKTSNGVVRRSFSKICPLLDPNSEVESNPFNARGHV